MVSESPYEDLLTDLNERKTAILDTAEAAMAPSQFAAFRRIVLKALGSNGFEAKLKLTISEMERNGTGRNSPAGKEVHE
jgi:hypothetical protein